MAETFAPPMSVNSASAETKDAGLGEQRSPLSLLAAIAFAYVALGFVFLAIVGVDPIYLILRTLAAFGTFMKMVNGIMPTWSLVLIAVVLLALAPIRRHMWVNKREIVLSFIYCSIIASVFPMVKNHMPLLVPYWADPMLIRIDPYINFKWAFSWLENVSTNALLKFYFNGWVLVALFLPTLMAVFDKDAARRRTFTIVWFACWVGLGNVLAVIFMSVGPIFLDKLPGGDAAAYADVMALLARDDGDLLLMVREHLWRVYTTNDFMSGSGISAFPSVHVGMATVVALYLGVRLREGADGAVRPGMVRALRVLGWALPVVLVAAFQVLSVHLGWHYAADGYASIALICALYWYLRRREALA